MLNKYEIKNLMESVKENYVVYESLELITDGTKQITPETMIYHLERDKWYVADDLFEDIDHHVIYVTPEGEVEEYLIIDKLRWCHRYVVKYKNEYKVFDFKKKALYPVEKLKAFLEEGIWYAIDKNDKLINLGTGLVKEKPFQLEDGSWYGVNANDELVLADKGWGELEIWDKLFG